MKRSLRHPLLDRDLNPGVPRTAARDTRRRLKSRRVRLPVVPSAFTAKDGASLRQGMVKRSCSTGLSYGPPVLGPAGFEPATTSLRGCSSTCIRNATSKQKRQGTARRLASASCPASGVRPPKAPCSPACIRVKTLRFSRAPAWRPTVGETSTVWM